MRDRPSAAAPRHLQHEAEHTKPPKKVSVLSYLTILFLAAFLLLLLALLMQERTIGQSPPDQTAALTPAQSVETVLENNRTLLEENQALQEKVQSLEEANRDLTTQADALEEQTQALSEELTRTRWAMDYFWQIDEAFALGRYDRCRGLIQTVEEQGLKDALPTESVTDNGRFSPLDRYQEIYDALY